MLSRLLTFLSGILFCLVLLGGIAAFGLPHLAGWMIVSAEPQPADAIVVLGGGDGSRLHKALELHDQGVAGQLILVDTKKEYWRHMLKKQCPDCDAEGKVTILEGSISTQTDARLSLKFCRENRIDSILVVTSPYHTHRSDLIFRKTFKGSGISLETVSTDDFGALRRPGDRWWEDRRTLETVWMEFGKCVYLLVGDW
ncbi:YdcF family protein [Desulfuromonas sp. TF]|uniref:YdcF family protein n=1 Tax=Desulfuromonas sp. TF TaxID=1232410 RepID=UPI0004297F26|nr:YdcF family protein [Desulfuromonas sp. TF]